MPAPFIVTGLPRSRTAWLAEFLGVPHEPSLRMDSISDLKGILEGKGASDCMMAWLWRDILEINPETRFVVVFRSVEAVSESLKKLGVVLPDWFLPEMEKRLTELAATPTAITVHFSDLNTVAACERVWDHCYPETPFAIWDFTRFLDLQNRNIQSDIKATLALLVERDEILRDIFWPRYGQPLPPGMDAPLPPQALDTLKRGDELRVRQPRAKRARRRAADAA